MPQEAATGGVYHSELSGKDYPRVQILSVKDVLEDHRKPDLPLLVLPAYLKAQRSRQDRWTRENCSGPSPPRLSQET
jgi:hypothetical protein